jgi:hypothetical protein
MILIGISGAANCGKDTACNYIANQYNFVKIAFADEIKRILMEVYSLSYQQLWGESKNRSLYDPRYKIPNSDEYLTARLGSQAFGDCGRSLYENTWVDYTFKQIKELQTSYFMDYEDKRGIFKNYLNPGKKNVVVSDCRYINELNKIKDMGGKVVRIKKTVTPLKGRTGKHSSEVNQHLILNSYFDEIIYNDGSIQDLYKKIDQFMEKNT